MFRSKGDMMWPRLLPVLIALGLIASSSAGPVRSLTNVTSVDLGLKDGGCAVGDVVYLPGEEFPGASACERCRCAGAGGGVTCARERCEPRPGCKALHRPDHCCPTYQCECEQEGRVYGNGEKLVDPLDPCRVCYCQGGEVVCRRIACFLRDDCTPRLVPGRCCPEYDNCPLRGVSTLASLTPSVSTTEEMTSSPSPSAPRENIKQEITIKEITPVSEIPVMPEVKVKEILPTPGIDVPEYPSSKSPLIVREATSERTSPAAVPYTTEKPLVVTEAPFKSTQFPISALDASTQKQEVNHDSNSDRESLPSKISSSTQHLNNDENYPATLTSAASMVSSSFAADVVLASITTKAPLLEEEDQTFFDHNPAFPPIPDDLSVTGNHEDELSPEPVESYHQTDHIVKQEPVSEPDKPTIKEVNTTPAPLIIPLSTSGEETTNKEKNSSVTTTPHNEILSTASSTRITRYDLSTAKHETPENNIRDSTEFNTEATAATETTGTKNSPMLNLRSAIPTEILNIPSSVPEDINGALDDITDSSASVSSESITTSVATENSVKNEDTTTPKLHEGDIASSSLVPQAATTRVDTATSRMPETTMQTSSPHPVHEQTTIREVKSNIVTEITAQTEFSSLPIETSDQNPKENSDNIEKELLLTSTVNPSKIDLTTARASTPVEMEVITVSRAGPPSTDSDSDSDNRSVENVETTEFVITAFGSSESATDAVELIKISADPAKSAAIIEPDQKKKNVLTDLINLVGDVAAIGDHTEGPQVTKVPSSAASAAISVASLAPNTPSVVQTAPAVPSIVPAPASTIGIAESEELIPVNAGYKSKNNNWNLNSITEVPVKSKVSPAGSKQKVVEIEDEEAEGISITDSPPPNDRAEPTTRRPLIDNVTDDSQAANKADSNKKDIEIITRSYVPIFNRRPTKVVMKKSGNDQSSTEETSSEVVTSTPPSSDVRTQPPTAPPTASPTAPPTAPPSEPAPRAGTTPPADATTAQAPDTTTVSVQ